MMERPLLPLGIVAAPADGPEVGEHVRAAFADGFDVVDLVGVAPAQPAADEHRKPLEQSGGVDGDDLAAATAGPVDPFSFPVRGRVGSDSRPGDAPVVLALSWVRRSTFPHVLGAARPAHRLEPVLAALARGESVDGQVDLAAVATLGVHDTEFTRGEAA